MIIYRQDTMIDLIKDYMETDCTYVLPAETDEYITVGNPTKPTQAPDVKG